MVLVDTSVWKESFTESVHSFKVRLQLEYLLDAYAVVVTDNVKFQTLVMLSTDQRGEFLSLISSVQHFHLKPSTWNLALQICWDLQNKIDEPSAESCLVAAAALQMNVPLFTLDEQQVSVSKIRKLSLLE